MVKMHVYIVEERGNGDHAIFTLENVAGEIEARSSHNEWSPLRPDVSPVGEPQSYSASFFPSRVLQDYHGAGCQCAFCKGEVAERAATAVKCPVCNGAGQVPQPNDYSSSAVPGPKTCHGCDGKGWVTP